jgi:hypothetical protein
MSHAIGPKLESSALLGMAPVAHLVSMPKIVPPTELRPEPIVTRTTPIADQPIIPAVKASGPIGAHIGKPMRKRSWFGRMLMRLALQLFFPFEVCAACFGLVRAPPE